MQNARISFEQTGHSANKLPQEVRWTVNKETRSIVVENKIEDDDDTWEKMGVIDVEYVEFVDGSFTDDRWVILRYTEQGEKTYQLVTVGPKRDSQTYYYKVGVERQLADGSYRMVDDSIVEEMPEIEFEHGS